MRKLSRKVAQKTLGSSWRTSACGVASIAWGLWLAHVLYVPSQSLYFNLVYALPTAELFTFIGIGLLFARDNKVSSEQAGVKRNNYPD